MCEEVGADLLFALVERNLENIKPTYESLKTNQRDDGELETLIEQKLFRVI